MSHIRGFLVQITDSCPLKPQNSRVINSFQKLWLAELPLELYTDFADVVFDIICPFDFGVQIVILRPLAKLGARPRFQSLTERDACGSLILGHYQLALAILCGVEDRIEVLRGFRVDIAETFGGWDGNLRLTRLTYSLALVFRIFQHRDVVLSLAEDGNLSEAV
jgi:hypothetical protein